MESEKKTNNGAESGSSPSPCSLLEAARIGAKWMRWWLSENECECEYGHTCGKTERENELRQIEAAILKAENTQEHLPRPMSEKTRENSDSEVATQHPARSGSGDSFRSADLVELLKEAYLFIGMQHKAHYPWRNSLDEWQKKVEEITNWNHFEEFEKYKQNA